jgi:hypothetical protein
MDIYPVSVNEPLRFRLMFDCIAEPEIPVPFFYCPVHPL